MKINTRLSSLSHIVLSLSLPAILHAGSPVWTLIPQTPTQFSIMANQLTTVQYLVTNQARTPKTLMMQPLKAVQQITTGSSICPNPFTLNAQQSCFLKLEINGSALDEPLVGGPVVCKTNPNQTPNANQCYQPASSQQLSVTRAETPGNTTITASVSSLALSVKCPTASAGCSYYNPALQGTPRIITLTNTSHATPALNVSYSASFLPTGTTITPASCNIAPNGTCIFTITPGETPSAAPGDTSPTSMILTFSGTNTNTLTANVNVLTYGSVYQSGYVFSIDDSTTNTASVAGTIMALVDQSAFVAWQADCSPSTPMSCITTTANSLTNGAQNTAAIVSSFTAAAIPTTDYAAGLCYAMDWYLPAICEMGYSDSSDPMPVCGIQGAPLVQNIQSNLIDNSIVTVNDPHWSSTQLSTDNTQAFYELFPDPGSQGGEYKEMTNLSIRCVKNFN